MNPALEQYIRENLAKGYTADDLAQAIRAQGGWTEEDIAAAFANIKAETLPTPNPAQSTPPQASTASVSTPRQAVQETSLAPITSSAPATALGETPKDGAWADRSAPKEHDPNAGGWHGSVEEFAEINARKRRVLGIAGLGAAVVVLAAVGGYLAVVSLSVTPEQALLKSVVAMREMNSLRYHATGTLAMALLPQGEMVEQTAMVLGTGEKANAKFEFAIDGAVELVEASTTVKHQRMDISLSGDGSAGPFSVALGGKIGMVQVPPDMYLTFMKMPKFAGFLDLTFLEGRSIHFTEEELASTPGAGETLGVLTATASPALFGPKFDPELLSEETRTKLGESYRTHAPLVISESEEKVKIGKSSAREFTVRMDRFAFDRFMAEAATYAPEFTEGADKPETKEALNILASTTVTFQVEEKSYFMRS
ncbi:MAG TPA: hypothetical protein VLB83_04340, partial [Candidatus Paceibacterota bacterium]|nr:hypothetical protein [Candidatus Paceibacterota bacterium]